MDFGSLTEKKGPLPIWAWALIVSIILFILYRHFRSGSSSSTTTSTDTTGADANVASIPTPDGSSIDTPVSSTNPDPLPGITGVDESTSTPIWDQPWWAGGQPTDTTPPYVGGTAPLSSPPPTQSPPTPVPKPAAKPVTTPALKSIIPGITGKVISQKILPSGAKLVTLEGGKQIEQAKGKKAYVVKKGK